MAHIIEDRIIESDIIFTDNNDIIIENSNNDIYITTYISTVYLQDFRLAA